jgi:phosphate-selective porin OprO/OprP
LKDLEDSILSLCKAVRIVPIFSKRRVKAIFLETRMLAKITISGVFICLCLTNIAQTEAQEFFNSSPNAVRLVSYSSQDEDEEEEVDLQDQIKRMEIRLRELEDDLENKLKDQKVEEREDDKDSDLEKRLAELEKSHEKTGKAVDKIKGGLGGLVYHGHKNPKMSFFGRIHLDWWAFPEVAGTLDPIEANPQDRINFRRMRIGVKGDLTDNMFYKYEGEFAGGNNPSYRDAYIGFKDVPLFNTVIMGNHKRPYGYDHLNSSRYNQTIERPFIVEAFNQDSRRLGISSNGFSEDLGWNWRYGLWNQQLTQNQSGYIGDHYQTEFAARVARTYWYDESSGGRGYGHFAVSGSVGAVDGNNNNQARYRTRPEARSSNRWLDTGAIAGADETALIGIESVINVGAFQIASEYMRNNVDRIDAIGEDVAFTGGYVQGSYLFTGEHHPWERKRGTLGRLKPFENFFLVRDCECNTQSGWGAWEGVLRYSWADLNDFDITGGEAASWTFGMNWYWNPYARMQLNYIVGEVRNGPNGGFGDYQIVGARMMVDF